MTRVVEVKSTREGVRCLVVHSQERQAYERVQREQEGKRLEEKLEALRQRVEAGKLKKEEAIAAAAERILQQHHGRRHFRVEVGRGPSGMRPAGVPPERRGARATTCWRRVRPR